MPTKTARGKAKTNNKKLTFGKMSFWKRKPTLIITAVIVAVGVGAVLKSFAATPRPTGVVDIDIASPTGDGVSGITYVAALQGFGSANTAAVSCPSTTTCKPSAWTSQGPALKNINLAFASGNKYLFMGGTGTDNRYYYKYAPCINGVCGNWTGYASAGGNTSSLQTAMISNGHDSCVEVFAIGTDRNTYGATLCPQGTAGWGSIAGTAGSNRLFKSNVSANGHGNYDRVYVINDASVVRSYEYYELDPEILTNGAYRAGSEHPIAHGDSQDNRYTAVGTDSTLYNGNPNAGWSKAFSDLGFVTDVFTAPYGAGSESVVRLADGTIYKLDGMFGAKVAGTNLGGNCTKPRVVGSSIYCIGSDKLVYYRGIPPLFNNGWVAL